MKERDLISWEVVDTIGKYTIIKTKERMVDVNGRPYGPILTWYDICLGNGNGDIVASFDNTRAARRWAKEN